MRLKIVRAKLASIGVRMMQTLLPSRALSVEKEKGDLRGIGL